MAMEESISTMSYDCIRRFKGGTNYAKKNLVRGLYSAISVNHCTTRVRGTDNLLQSCYDKC